MRLSAATVAVAVGLVLAAVIGVLVSGPPTELLVPQGSTTPSATSTAWPQRERTAVGGAAGRPTALPSPRGGAGRGAPTAEGTLNLAAACEAGGDRPAARTPVGHPGLPALVVPDGIGVNIHHRQGPEEDFEDLDMIAAAGFRFVRDDMRWNMVEAVKGTYDFAPYDRWMAELARRRIRPLFILMFSNRLYEEDDRAIRTPEGRAAFAAFAAAAARRYAGRGIVWEIWNEPNGASFWRPQPNLDEYYALVVETSRALRRADPTAPIVAPATGLDWPWLEGLFARGLLEHVDGVSVHAARALDPPETAAADYAKLRALIARFSAKPLPIISSEWGYSSVTHQREVVEDVQARFLARQFLVNLWQGIPLHIWFEWRHVGGPVTPRYTLVREDRRPKPSYVAAKTLLSTLEGFAFVRRVPLGSDDTFLMLFERCPQRVLAAWSTAGRRDVRVVLDAQAAMLVTMSGARRPLERDGAVVTIRLSDEPQYLVLGAP